MREDNSKGFKKMKETSVANKIVIAERDNIAAVIEKGKVSEFFVLVSIYLAKRLFQQHLAHAKSPFYQYQRSQKQLL